MKSKILLELKENNLKFVSGEVLSINIGVSRTAVWKAIKQLKSEGYKIESSPSKGYKLTCIPDILYSDEVKFNLDTKLIGRDIKWFSTLDSTNIYAKKLAIEGCNEGTVIIAETQTAGRGRLGREWSSADGLGIWMSIILKPSILPEFVQLITLAASVAIVKAIYSTTGIQTGIKWPNDIILKDRKLCGILTEMSCEADHINYVIIGVGINVNQDTKDFCGQLSDKAISLKLFSEDKINYKREDLVKNILREIEKAYLQINNMLTGSIIDDWRRFSVTLGKEVTVVSKENKFTAIAEDITDEGKLIVRCADGKIMEILSGEVSVIGIMGYTGGER